MHRCWEGHEAALASAPSLARVKFEVATQADDYECVHSALGVCVGVIKTVPHAAKVVGKFRQTP